MLATGTPVMTAEAIAGAVGGKLIGSGKQAVEGVAPLDRASPSDLSFLSSAKYLSLFEHSAAGVVLVPPEFEAVPGRCAARVVVALPHEALLSLIPRFYHVPARAAGVHPTAAIASSVSVPPDACIEAFAVVGDGVVLGRGAWIGAHCVVGDGVRIGNESRLLPHVTLGSGTILGDRVVVHSGARIGNDGFGYVFREGAHRRIPHVGKCVIGDDVEIGANCCVDRGSIDDTVIGDGTKLDNLVHVAHNVRLGRLCLVMAQVGVAGSARIEDGAILAGQVGVGGHLTVGAKARLAARSGVICDVPSGETWSGYPARPHGEAMRASAALFKLSRLIRRIERLLDREGT